jgi:hypothetical protein
MTNEELHAELIARLAKQEQVVRRAIDAHKTALATTERAQENESHAYDAMIAAQQDRTATLTAMRALGFTQDKGSTP